jgi:hypothetical protein
MRRWTVLLVGWFGCSVVAGAAGADRLSEPGLCRNLENRLERCNSGARLNTETRASCDRIEDGFRALCGPREIIYASGAAEGAALDLLREDYEVVPIEDANGDAFPHHVVIGASDLDDPDVIALLRAAHRVGKTIAIVHATKAEARTFHRLVRPGQEANCAPAEGQREIELYGLQQSVTRIPPQDSSFCLLSLDHHGAAADRRWLRNRFGPTPPQPPAGGQAGLKDSRASLSGLATDATAFLSELVERWLGGRPARAQTTPEQQLTDLATATHCSFKATDTLNSPSLGSVEQDVYVYAMRDFTDTGCSSCANPGADYYLVQDNVTFTPAVTGAIYDVYGSSPFEASSGLFLTQGLLDLEFADPQTVTTYESSYTNSSSVTASESVGFNSQGPNVTAGGSVTAGESTTYVVPPTTIENLSDTTLASTAWAFYPQSTTTGADFDVAMTWTWDAPQDAYPDGGTGSGQIGFYTTPDILTGNVIISGSNEQTSTSTSNASTQFFSWCYVTYPFSAWTVNPPQLSSLDPTSTSIDGGQFTITGQYLYPGSVTGVLVGGQAIPLSTNVDLVDDTTIDVTVGDLTLTPGTYPVQVETQYNGENRSSNTLNLKLTD